MTIVRCVQSFSVVALISAAQPDVWRAGAVRRSRLVCWLEQSVLQSELEEFSGWTGCGGVAAHPLFTCFPLTVQDTHRNFRAAMREFVDKEITPFCHEWDEAKEMPKSLFAKCAQGEISSHAKLSDFIA
jgi:hypothetical protein